MYSTISSRISDAFSQHPTMFIYIVLSFAILSMLIFDLYYFKYNQISRMVTVRIGKEEDKKGFDITTIFGKYFENRQDQIEAKLRLANVQFKPKEYMTFLTVGALIGGFIGAILFPISNIWKLLLFWLPFDAAQEFFGRILAAVVLGFLGSLLPRLMLQMKISRRKKDLDSQIQDALLNIADALKSGHVIQDAIKIVGNEMPYPIGPEFARAYREMDAGKTLELALQDLKKRVDLKDFTMAINAMEIQYEVGGKLEPLLRGMTGIIQERQELKKEIEKTIAGSKMVGIILLAAPVFFAVTFTMLNKDQFTTMFTVWQGQVLLAIGVVSYGIAAWLIFWIIKDVSKEQ